jgi:hypothetical protein
MGAKALHKLPDASRAGDLRIVDDVIDTPKITPHLGIPVRPLVHPGIV